MAGWLGHGAFFAIGGYTSAVLTTHDFSRFNAAAWAGVLRQAHLCYAHRFRHRDASRGGHGGPAVGVLRMAVDIGQIRRIERQLVFVNLRVAAAEAACDALQLDHVLLVRVASTAVATQAIIDVVVVFPCVPATTMDSLSAIINSPMALGKEVS